MKFKPKKSRSLSVRKGKIDATTIFTVGNQQTPTVSQEPVKSLGRWYDSSMKDTKRGLETVEHATEGLLHINRCGFQGKLKVWCLQLMLIPKLLWPLLGVAWSLRVSEVQGLNTCYKGGFSSEDSLLSSSPMSFLLLIQGLHFTFVTHIQPWSSYTAYSLVLFFPYSLIVLSQSIIFHQDQPYKK